ncbi:MAG: type II secretion system F family protein, partial [Chloroflexota bacterium]|nr:type II secretion system F family protein [Chloroflexota bacterium]
RDFVLFSVASGAMLGVVAQLMLGWVALAALCGVAGALAPLVYFAHRQARRREAVQNGLVQAIGQLRDSVRAGLAVAEALTGLATNGPEALRGEFARLVREMRFTSLEDALAELRDRVADPVMDVFVATLLLNEKVGGRNVTHALDRLAYATRAELRTQQEVRAYQAQNVLTARFLAGIPLVFLIGTRVINPSYLAIFNGRGQLLLVASVFSVAIGYAAMLHITRLPGETRVLR